MSGPNDTGPNHTWAPGGGGLRAALEAFVAAGIDLLDAMDAAGFDREPDGDDEIVSEDDAVIPNLKSVGRQWA
jgi:hypothetical protein